MRRLAAWVWWIGGGVAGLVLILLASGGLDKGAPASGEYVFLGTLLVVPVVYFGVGVRVFRPDLSWLRDYFKQEFPRG